MIADANQNTVWRWDQGEPFGNDVPNNNPSGTGAFDFPLRFPGQYFDRETGLFYNYHRNYTSDLDRYIEVDPIGIRGGINIYVYVTNPLTQIDPFGLMGFGGGGSAGSGRPSGSTNSLTPRARCVIKCHVVIYPFCAAGGIALAGFAGAPTLGAGAPIIFPFNFACNLGADYICKDICPPPASCPVPPLPPIDPNAQSGNVFEFY
jgi:RHS repeat-associated protein